MNSAAIFIVVIFALVGLIMAKSTRIFGIRQRGVVFRLGKFRRVLGPGLHIAIPFLDRVVTVDLPKEIRGWEGMSPEQLQDRVKRYVLIEKRY